MFDSGLIVRIHHLYVIQTLLEFHKQCNIWYSRLKHKFAFILNKRLRLVAGIRSLRAKVGNKKQATRQQAHYDEQFYYDETFRCPGAGRFCGQFLTDLNQMLMGAGGRANSFQNPSVSIPMQMLLLPFVVHQPRVMSSPESLAAAPSCQAEAALTATTMRSNDHMNESKQHELAFNTASLLHNDARVPAVNRHLHLHRHHHHQLEQRPSQQSSAANTGAQTSASSCFSSSRLEPSSPVSDYQSFVMREKTRVNSEVDQPSLARSCGFFQSQTRRTGLKSIAFRNPLVCFPSTSNHEMGHVKYM